MHWKINLFSFFLCCCWCQVAYSNYELDVQGEAQQGFYVTIKIGHPPQNINLIIDTGSSNIAIAVAPPSKGISNNVFHYSDSNTFRKLGSNIAIHYVRSNWRGFLASDLVSVSGKNHSVRCIIACMTSIHNVFDTNSMFTGILGLAYPVLAKPNSSVLSFFDEIRKDQNVNNTFSLSLCGPSFLNTNTFTSSGKLHLGYLSSEHYNDEIIYSPIVKERLYEIALTMIKVGSKDIDVNCQELNHPMTFIDTGTTQLLVSPVVYKELISKIKMYVRDKEVQLQLNIAESVSKFWLNETAACVPKKYFNISFFPDLSLSLYHTDNSSFDLVISPDLYLLPWQEFSVENTCFSLGFGVSSFGTIIGSTILKGYYVIFDRFNKQIGFANSSFCQRNFLSFVTMPSFSLDKNYSNCKCDEYENNRNHSTNVNAGTVILLLFILILLVLMLYRMILWVQAIRLQSKSYLDTRSLFSEKYKL